MRIFSRIFLPARKTSSPLSVALISLRILLTTSSRLQAFANDARDVSVASRRITYVRKSANARGHAAIRHTGDRLWQLILMAMENLRALVKIKESDDSCRFYLRSYLRGAFNRAKVTDLFGEERDSIRS